jgi:preprotein translocase subunit SecG
MLIFLTTLHIIICLFLILVVLLQQGKGADLSVFGGGSTQAVFGARGAATLLHKLTVAGFIGFIVTTIGIGILGTGASKASVMSTMGQESAAQEAETPAAPQPAAGTPSEAAAEGDAAAGEPAGQGDPGETQTQPAETPADAPPPGS